MTCANWMLTIASVVAFIFAVWPGIGSAVVSKTVAGIALIAIIAIAWTGVKCKYCNK